MKLLHIDSSIQGENSASRRLTREIVARELRDIPGLEVTYRDLAAREPAHLGRPVIAQSDPVAAAADAAVLAEFMAADVIVIGAPIYNFSIPSQLKAWIDRICVAGRTFRYTAEGPVGLAGGKRVIVALARGGVHAAGEPGEFGESYLGFIFGFLGIGEVSFLHAQGLSISAEQRAASLDAALAQISGQARLAA
jgi:FMN-dependent NADH-azoreductase